MKLFAGLTIVATFWLGLIEGDCTAAVAMLVIFGPTIFCKKEEKSKGSIHNGK